MCVVITNVSDHDGTVHPSEYVVQINRDPAIARFEHMRADGLAECLRKAAAAVDAALAPRPSSEESKERTGEC